MLDLPERDGVWDPVWERLRAGGATGARVVPQVSCRPMRFDFDLQSGCASLDAVAVWRRFREAGDVGARTALLVDPAFRAAVRAATLARPDAPSSRRWAAVVVEDVRRDELRGFVGATLAEVAAARGGDAIDALFDIAGADYETRLPASLEDALDRNPDILVFTFCTTTRLDQSLMTNIGQKPGLPLRFSIPADMSKNLPAQFADAFSANG